MSLQGQDSLLSYLKTLSVGPAKPPRFDNAKEYPPENNTKATKVWENVGEFWAFYNFALTETNHVFTLVFLWCFSKLDRLYATQLICSLDDDGRWWQDMIGLSYARYYNMLKIHHPASFAQHFLL